MSVLDCLYLIVSPLCSSLLSFPWTSPHGWKRSFLCPSFSKHSLTPWGLFSSWHGLCAPSPHLSCPLCVFVPARRWDKTLSTEILFFLGVLGVLFLSFMVKTEMFPCGLVHKFFTFQTKHKPLPQLSAGDFTLVSKGLLQVCIYISKLLYPLLLRRKRRNNHVLHDTFFIRECQARCKSRHH